MRSAAAAALLGALLPSVAARPSQVHTAFAADASFRVAWKTPGAESSSCVYGASPTAMTSNATGSAVSYLPGHGYHHAVLIAAPAGSSEVFWSCGSVEGGMTNATRFAFPSPASSFSTMVFADW